MSDLSLQESRMAIWIWGDYELLKVTVSSSPGQEHRSLSSFHPVLSGTPHF